MVRRSVSFLEKDIEIQFYSILNVGANFRDGQAKLICNRGNKTRIVTVTCCRPGKEKASGKKIQFIA